jgi:hypothetical protein
VFNWLLEVEETSEPWEGGRIVWGIRYVLEGDTRFHGHTTPAHGGGSSSHFAQQQRRARLLKEGGNAHDDDERRKLTARFDTQKDDIHAVLPISKVSHVCALVFRLSEDARPLTRASILRCTARAKSCRIKSFNALFGGN